MFNLGAGEVLVILLLALIVLGPQRLPEAAKQVGRFTGEIKRLSSGFQQEMKDAFDAESEASARAKGAAAATPPPAPPEVGADPASDATTTANGADPASPVDPADRPDGTSR